MDYQQSTNDCHAIAHDRIKRLIYLPNPIQSDTLKLIFRILVCHVGYPPQTTASGMFGMRRVNYYSKMFSK
jgi:hypothetical protein